MDVRQRADDALEAVTSLRDGALADLRQQMESSGHKSLGKVDAFLKNALTDLLAELRKLTGATPPAKDSPPAGEKAPEAASPAPAAPKPAEPAKA
jgi:hypothetical protein